MRDGTPWSVDLQLVTAKGRDIWVRATGEVDMGPAGPERLYGSFQDIDELKNAQLALEKSQERIASIVDVQQEAICRFLPDTTLTFVNATFCRLLGYEGHEEQLLGQRWRDVLSEEDHQVFQVIWRS